MTFGAGIACAQDFQSGYFLDNYVFGYRYNPSTLSEKSFLSIGTGTVSIDAASNLGLSSFIYPNEAGNGLVTALHPSVSTKDFADKLTDANTIGTDIFYNLLSFGGRNEQSMFNFEVNLRANVFASLPKDLFMFLKSGSSSSAYDLSSLHAQGDLFAEVAIGYGRRINDKFTWGARIKGLVGFANANLNFDGAQLVSNPTELSLTANGAARISAPVLLSKDADGKYSLNNIDVNLPGLMNDRPGFGAAVDLGVTWKPFDNLTVNLAVTDLGAIKWNYNYNLESAVSVLYEGIELTDNGDFQEELNNKLDELKDLLEDYTISDKSKGSLEMIPLKVNAGVRYNMPFYKRLSVGALATWKADKYNGWYDMRAGATITPLKFFSLSANCGVSTFGGVFGGAFSLNLLGINVFAGIDGYMGDIAYLDIKGIEAPVPVNNFRYNTTFGLTVNFGKRWPSVKGW